MKTIICTLCGSVVKYINRYTIPMYCVYPDKEETIEPIDTDKANEIFEVGKEYYIDIQKA